MRKISRRTLGLALIPSILVGLAGAIRAAQPLLSPVAAHSDARKQAHSYQEVARLLRSGNEAGAVRLWAEVDSQALLIPQETGAEVGNFSLESALLDAAAAMTRQDRLWKERTLVLADRIEVTPGQSERGYDLAWRVRKLAKG
jgi:hypothetical protein